jgi:hypothetical protein
LTGEAGRIEPGTETAALPREYDGPQSRLGPQRLSGIDKSGKEIVVEGIHRLGPVQPNISYSIGDVDEYRIAHK